MNRSKTITSRGALGRTASVLAAFLLVLALGLAERPVLAASHLTSTNVALIPNNNGSGFGGGGAGTFNPAWFPGMTFTTVNPAAAVTPASLAPYDTVLIWQFCTIGSFPAFTSNLVAWVQSTGGKVIIWDADSCSASTSYAWLVSLGATFDRFAPNQIGGSGGTLVILEDNGLGSPNSLSPFFINGPLIAANTDAISDLTVVNENTISPLWCGNMRGTNGLNQSGFAHMYTKVGALVGAPDGFIIYSGLDTDFISTPGATAGGQIAKLLGLDLAHGWGPAGSAETADLLCQAPVGNLTLTPSVATNAVGSPHTVVAHTTTQSNSFTIPVIGTTVSFSIISGPNTGTSGTSVSDSNGFSSFTWVSASAGIDIIRATAVINGVTKSNTATKIWIGQANHPPTAVCKGTVVVSADSATCTASASIDGGSSDPDTNDVITVTQIPPGPYPIGSNTVTLLVTDSHGASNACTTTVIVQDTTPPNISCPSNIVQNTDPGQCSAVVNFSVSASDSCSGAAINVNVYSGHSTSGGGTPYSGIVGSFGASGVTFATDTGYNWHPFGLGDFGADITGCLNVAADDIYSFSLNSDDGSLLYIDGNLVVDDGGPHSPNVASGSALLLAGLHSFEVQFFEDFGGDSGVDLGLPAGVTYASCGLPVTCTPPSGSSFPKGTNTVVCCAADAAGNTNCCSFTVTVQDKEAPLAACREATNPSGEKIPTAGKNPKSGQNPDGFYQLLGKDNCDPNPLCYIQDSITGYLFGPFANGDIVKITQSNHDTIRPMAGVVVAHIQLVGDALCYAVDADGNVGASVSCLVPKPPK